MGRSLLLEGEENDGRTGASFAESDTIWSR